MKWREVDRIPFGGRSEDLPEGMLYEAVPTVMEVNGTEYLVIDVFRAMKTGEAEGAFAPAQMEGAAAPDEAAPAAVPVLRAAYTKHDYGVYWPLEGEKGKCRMTDQYQYGNLKVSTEPVYGEVIPGRKTYMTPEGEDTLFLFVHGKKKEAYPWKKHWTFAVEDLEDHVSSDRRIRKDKRDMERMEQRHADTPEAPAEFLSWAGTLLDYVGYLFYRKKNGRGTVRCSRCGEEYDIRFKRREGIEAMAEHISREPESNLAGACEMCGGIGIYKPIGRMQNEYHIQEACFLIQPFRENGIVIREFIAEKILSVDAAEENSLGEMARAYFIGAKEQIDWCPYRARGCEYWTYTNGGGMNPWKMHKGRVWSRSWELIKDTEYGHTGCREYLWHLQAEHLDEISPEKYMNRYRDHRYLEMAVKTGMWAIVNAVFDGYTDVVPHPGETKPADQLCIWPERLRMLQEAQGNRKLLRVLQGERRAGLRLTGKQIQALRELCMDAGSVERIRRYMGVQRFLNRVEGYAGVSFAEDPEDLCGNAAEQLRHMAQTYLDYLDMQGAAGADMADQIVQHPRDLLGEHNRLVIAANEEKNRKHCEEKEAEFGNIRKRYRKLSRKYAFEADGLRIRPAKSATEIILEGQLLHHCVGGDRYLGGHDRGSSLILMLRKADMPDVPYITVEIETATNRIRQWYGVRDTKPDKERIEGWLKEYEQILAGYGDMGSYRAAVRADEEIMAKVTEEPMRVLLVAAAG